MGGVLEAEAAPGPGRSFLGVFQKAQGLQEEPFALLRGLFPVAPEEGQDLGEGAGQVLHQGLEAPHHHPVLGPVLKLPEEGPPEPFPKCF